jgi:hypothetical protein
MKRNEVTSYFRYIYIICIGNHAMASTIRD